MASFISKCVVLLSIATASVQALPTTNNVESSTRASTLTIPDGDFSAPLAGSWILNTTGVLTSSDAKRIEAEGNYVIQIDKAATCPKKPYSPAGYAYLYGTIENVAPAQEFSVSFQYRSLVDTIYYNSFGIAVYNALRKGSGSSTKKVKANEWYTYTEHYVANHKLDSSTIELRFQASTCGSENWLETMQIDDFTVTSP